MPPRDGCWRNRNILGLPSSAADFLLRTMRTKEGRLLRTYGAAPGQAAEAKLNGYLDDYAYLVHGLLCLHDATENPRWLQEAGPDRSDGEVSPGREERRFLLHLE